MGRSKSGCNRLPVPIDHVRGGSAKKLTEWKLDQTKIVFTHSAI